LYSAIVRATEKKRVTAVVEDLAASGAYYAIAGASEIVLNPTGEVGSIGTYIVLADASRMFEGMGVDIIIIRSGPHKGAGVQGSKITAEQIAQLQAVVDEQARHFITAVARGRRMSVNKVTDLADGRILVGNQAKAGGLVDRIGTVEDVLAEVSARTAPLMWNALRGQAAYDKLTELAYADIRVGERDTDPAERRVRQSYPKLAAAADAYSQFPISRNRRRT
jgi:signal peptide peptidase SppA